MLENAQTSISQVDGISNHRLCFTLGHFPSLPRSGFVFTELTEYRVVRACVVCLRIIEMFKLIAFRTLSTIYNLHTYVCYDEGRISHNVGNIQLKFQLVKLCIVCV